MVKALVLFSGGLDSLLAVKILEAQGVEVTALFFETHFFDRKRAQDIAAANNLNLRVEEVGDEHLEVVKTPKHGRGKHMNPCIDCHIFMIKKAREIMETEGYDFIATGEVLGQRPMSQNPDALKKIEREAGLEKKLLRPLSAKLLPVTEAEEKGLVDREKLFEIQGRGRSAQLGLAKEFGIEQFQTPAGGCLLTEEEFSKRLQDLSERWPAYTGSDIALIKSGRIFWEGENIVVIGRDKNECQNLVGISQPEDRLVDLVDIPGPTTLVRGGDITESVIDRAIALTIKYAHKADKKTVVKVRILKNGNEEIREINR